MDGIGYPAPFVIGLIKHMWVEGGFAALASASERDIPGALAPPTHMCLHIGSPPGAAQRSVAMRGRSAT